MAKAAKTKKTVKTKAVIPNMALDHMATLYMSQYGEHVVKDRALADFRDGFKPVQRRIVWGMYKLGISAGGGTKKCAKITGDVMGNYHAHGDSAIYNALANMCGDSDVNCPHNINTSIPLALGQGGLGYINSRPSDARYTEAKLSYYAEKTFLNKDYLNVTDMALSYDGENKEPIVLPALLPNLLLNGTAGIAVGVTGFIPPFEYKGVSKLVYKALQGNKITPKDCLDNLVFNFKYGGKIEATAAELTEYYKSGEGTIKIYPNSERDGNIIYLLDATPYFAPEKVFSSLMGDAGTKKGKKKKRPSVGIEEVMAVEDISDAAEPFKMKITLKRGLSIAECKKAHEKIIKKISNTIPLRTNVVEQIDSEKTEFRKWNIPTLIMKWAEWRISLEKKKQGYILEKLKSEIAYLKLMHFACDHLDVIFKILKDRKPEPDKRLAKALKISEADAKTILDRRARDLSALAKADLEKTVKEKKLKAKEAMGWYKQPAKKVTADLKEFVKNPFLLGIGVKSRRKG